MPSEGLDLTPKKKPPESGKPAMEGKNNFEAFRRKIVHAMLMGGSLGLFNACGPTEDEIKKMPLVSIEQLAQDMGTFSQMNLVKVEGHVEDLGEKRKLVPNVTFDTDGETHFELKTEITHFYKLHSEADKASPNVEMMETKVGLLGAIIQNKTPMEYTYQVVGRVVSVGRGKEAKFVLSLVRAKQIDAERPIVKKN